jgi:predicted phage baseplate assembly protein
VRNPLPAWGGSEPQPIEEVKQLAPAAFHAEQFRAVTEADYADVAEKHPQVSKAVATFRWTGSWYTVFVAIDPLGQTDLFPALERRLRAWITRFMLAGYDLEIDPPIYVPLEVELDVCVSPGHFRAHVEEAVLTALSNRTFADGTQGLFHPDNFTFGQSLYLSQLYAAVEAVEGVDSAVVRRFIRVTDDDPDPDRPATQANVDQSYIAMDRLEVIRLDNDRNFPENGALRLNMLGGK